MIPQPINLIAASRRRHSTTPFSHKEDTVCTIATATS